MVQFHVGFFCVKGAFLNQLSDDQGHVEFVGSTPIGHVLSVRGSEAHIGLPAPWPDNGTA